MLQTDFLSLASSACFFRKKNTPTRTDRFLSIFSINSLQLADGDRPHTAWRSYIWVGAEGFHEQTDAGAHDTGKPHKGSSPSRSS